jgi:hypothetical protein
MYVWYWKIAYIQWFGACENSLNDEYFPDLDTFEAKMKNYTAYGQLHGDMGNSHQFNFSYGNWVVVGHGEKFNSKCGVLRRYDACDRVELHRQNKLNDVSHAGEVYVHMVHHWCFRYFCPTCYLKGACLREAEHSTQRIMKGSKGYTELIKGREVKHMGLGQPQHIIFSAPKSDFELANSKHDVFFGKVRQIASEVGVLSGGWVFHGFRYADYNESMSKGVPFGYYWNPHYHFIGFIQGGYGACRHCSKTARVVHTAGGKVVTKHGDAQFCSGCDGFEHRVRESFKKYQYIIMNTDERKDVRSTIWYQLSHMAIQKEEKL